MDFFEFPYSLLDFLYSEALDRYLSGYNCETSAYSGANVYPHLFVVAAVCAVAASAVYYLKVDPTNGKRKMWLIFAGIAAALSGLVATYLPWHAAESFLIGGCMLRDDSGNTLISFVDYIGLGINNAFVSFILFFFLSLAFQRRSINNRHTPF